MWLPVKDDLSFTRTLLEKENILVLPGSFLSRLDLGENPGSNFVRLALVYEDFIIKDALTRIAQWI